MSHQGFVFCFFLIKSALEQSIFSKEELYTTINPSENNHAKYRKHDLIRFKEKPK